MEKTIDPLRRALGDNPLKCVDVGARGGQQANWLDFSDLIQTDCFEPDAKACAEQAAKARPRENWFPAGLGGFTGMGKLHVLNKASGSSLYPPNPTMMNRFSKSEYGDLKAVIDVPFLTFSDFILREKRPLPNLVKLDVQGAELDILKGLQPAHWTDLLAVQAEVEFVELYKAQPLFADVDAHMKAHGFILMDLLPVRGYRVAEGQMRYYLKKHLGLAIARKDISRRLVAGDALYLRDPQTLIDERNATSCYKFLLILLMYRFFDEALWFVEQACAKQVFLANDKTALIETVKRAAPSLRWRERTNWLGRNLRKLLRASGASQRRIPDQWLTRKWYD